MRPGLREVLAQQPVHVLVAAALPGAGPSAEVHRHPRLGAQLEVTAHLLALVPGQRPCQPRRHRAEHVDEGGAQPGRSALRADVDEDDGSTAAFHQRAIAVRFDAPMIRSPSKWPTSTRSATCAGRCSIERIGCGRPRGRLLSPRGWGRRWWRPVRRLRTRTPSRAYSAWYRLSVDSCRRWSSGHWRRRVAAICSGLHRTSRRCWTNPRSTPSQASRRSRCRRRLSRASRCARAGRYTPAGSVLRRSSRLTVDGLRPGSLAVARTVVPRSCSWAMTARSFSDRNLGEGTTTGLVITGGYSRTSPWDQGRYARTAPASRSAG